VVGVSRELLGRHRLNLASGTDLRPAADGWVNLDIVPKWPLADRGCDLVWDARTNEIPFPDGLFEEIVAGYLFLHVPYKHHEPLAREMFRVMAPGGRLEVGEVDMPHAMRVWMGDPYNESAREMVWGEQGSVVGDELAAFDKHCAGHSEATLKKLLSDAGFTDLARVKIHSAEVWYEMTIQGKKQ
jgi:ubiquinone/menaquinone biosynthesis C-methylase UbiE